MFLCCIGHSAVLLLVIKPALVLASSEYEDNKVKTVSQAIIDSVQVPWIKGMRSVIRSSEDSCADDIATTLDAVNIREPWALQMLDASAKIQSGIMKGNVRNLGNYDQCVEVTTEYNGTNILGQYCTVSFGILSSAVCVPSSCNETQVADLVDNIIQNVSRVINASGLEVSGVSCVPLEPEEFSMGETLTIIFFSVIIAFIVFCTICEFVKKCEPADLSPVVNELARFSLYTNAMALLSTKVNPGMMPAIQGIRFLSTCWVVLGHRYVITLMRPMENSSDILKWYNSWSAVYIQAAPFAVDTFFVISGFLMTYLFLKSKQSGKRSNLLMMYLHRYLRLTPCLAVLILFVAVLLHRVADGPLWNTLSTLFIEPCRKNWWVDLLYIQNFVRVDGMCLPHSWYLAVDMQLFWISPIILYPLYRWPKFGLGILCLFLAGSVVTPAVVLAVNRYANALIRFDVPANEIMVNFRYFYIPTYNRACAYFVGILLGYDVANKKRHFTTVNVAINWAVACILMLASGLTTRRVYNTEIDYDMILETAFAVLLRPMWSIAIAWIVYACTYGYGGPVARFLSLPIFLPLSRLSYCIYLVHMVIQGVKVAMARSPDRFVDFIILNHFWGDLVLSIAVAFIFSLFFESPVIVLEKMLTGRGRKPPAIREPQTKAERGIDNKGMTMGV